MYIVGYLGAQPSAAHSCARAACTLTCAINNMLICTILHISLIVVKHSIINNGRCLFDAQPHAISGPPSMYDATLAINAPSVLSEHTGIFRTTKCCNSCTVLRCMQYNQLWARAAVCKFQSSAESPPQRTQITQISRIHRNVSGTARTSDG